MLKIALRPTGEEREIAGLPYQLYSGLDDEGDVVWVWLCWPGSQNVDDELFAQRFSVPLPDQIVLRVEAQVKNVK